MRKYLKLRDKLIGDESKADNAAPDEKPQSLQTSNTVQQQVNQIDELAGEMKAHTIQEPNFESTYRRTAQNEESMTEPPAPPARKPRKTDNKPPQPVAQLIDPPAEVAQHVDP